MQVKQGFITSVNGRKIVKADAFSRQKTKEAAIAEKRGLKLAYLCEAEQHTVRVSGCPILQHETNNIVHLFVKR